MASAVVQEIKDSAAFLAVRKARQADAASMGTLETSLSGGIVAMIGRSRVFSTADAALVMECMTASGSLFGVDGDAAITKAIERRVEAAGANATTNTGNVKHDGQVLKHTGNFLTQSDWDFIRGNKQSIFANMNRIIWRFNLIGMTHPNEQTLKWALALLIVAHFPQLPPHKQIFKHLQELKEVAESTRKPYGLGHLLTYPESPVDLPADMLAHGYVADDPAITVRLEGIEVVAENHVPLRKKQQIAQRR